MSAPALLYGRHAVAAALRARPGDVRELWLRARGRDARAAELRARAEAAGVPVQEVDGAALRRHLGDAAHQGVAARARPPAPRHERALEPLLERTAGAARLLALDGVTDPRNLGACLRVAEAAGIDAVLVPARRRAALTAAACKAAAGAAERVPLIQAGNLAQALRRLKRAGVWLYAAAADGERELWSAAFQPPWAILLGGEGAGLRAQSRALCDAGVRIPMRGEAESLNVACAAGVLLFAAGRAAAGAEA